MIELIMISFLVVGISHLCSLAESVLYSVPESFIAIMERKGGNSGRILKKLRENVDEPITAFLTLNTIANTAGAALAGAVAAEILGRSWVGYYSAALTLTILLFSEVIPKTAGVVYSRILALIIAFPLQVLVVISRPAIWICGLTTKLITRGRDVSPLSREEIMGTARIGLDSGIIHHLEADVIQNLISLRSRKVQDVMTPRTVITSFESQTTVGEVLRKEEFFGHSRIPVYFDDVEEIGGVVLRSEVLHAAAQRETDQRLHTLMRPVHFIPATISLDRALLLFLERREHLFIALDEHGGVSGLVTLEDVLEELLGREIVDESDRVEDMRQLARRRRIETMNISEG